jgi:iron complex transport system substrate-binding protein
MSVAVLVAALIVVPVMLSKRLPDASSDHDGLRIVSISPSVTEMLFALEVGDSVVGVTDFCDYPPEAKAIERVGGFGTPSMEKLMALSPDLVIGTGVERAAATATLRRMGIKVLWIKTDSIPELFDALRQIGQAVGKAEEAEEVVAAMRAEFDAVAETYQNAIAKERPKVFVEVWYDPITTAAKRSFINGVITRAGGINVAGELDSDYPTVNPEKVVEWNPDVIVSGYMNQEQPEETLAKRIGWSEVTAVRSGRIINDIPSELLLRPGPRVTEGVWALARRLHGRAVDDDEQGTQ